MAGLHANILGDALPSEAFYDRLVKYVAMYVFDQESVASAFSADMSAGVRLAVMHRDPFETAAYLCGEDPLEFERMEEIGAFERYNGLKASDEWKRMVGEDL